MHGEKILSRWKWNTYLHYWQELKLGWGWPNLGLPRQSRWLRSKPKNRSTIRWQPERWKRHETRLGCMPWRKPCCLQVWMLMLLLRIHIPYRPSVSGLEWTTYKDNLVYELELWTGLLKSLGFENMAYILGQLPDFILKTSQEEKQLLGHEHPHHLILRT